MAASLFTACLSRNITRNQITTLPAHSFAGLPNLEKLLAWCSVLTDYYLLFAMMYYIIGT